MNKHIAKHKKFAAALLAALLALSAVFLFPIAVSARTNIALGAVIDAFCCEIDGARAFMLVDSDVNFETKWQTEIVDTSHPGEFHWVILDFKTEKTFDEIRLIKASQGIADFGRTELNAGGFIFEVSADKISWHQIISETGNGDEVYEGSFPPVTARYLRLVITNPVQNGDENGIENQAVRLYDLKVFEYTPAGEDDEGLMVNKTPQSADTSDALLSFVVFFAAAAALFVAVWYYGRKKTS